MLTILWWGVGVVVLVVSLLVGLIFYAAMGGPNVLVRWLWRLGVCVGVAVALWWGLGVVTRYTDPGLEAELQRAGSWDPGPVFMTLITPPARPVVFKVYKNDLLQPPPTMWGPTRFEDLAACEAHKLAQERANAEWMQTHRESFVRTYRCEREFRPTQPPGRFVFLVYRNGVLYQSAFPTSLPFETMTQCEAHRQHQERRDREWGLTNRATVSQTYACVRKEPSS